MYHLTEDIHCQFGGHAHANGYVVRTCCGKIYYAGHICASRQIMGVQQFIKAYTRAQKAKGERSSRKAVLRQTPGDALERLNRWVPFAEQVEQFVTDLKRWIPGIHDELELRSHEKGGRGREVAIIDEEWHRTPRDKRVGKPNDRVLSLSGFEVLNPSIKARAVRSIRDRVRFFMGKVTESEPALMNSEDLYEEWVDISKDAERVTEKLAAARNTFTVANLQLLAYAARRGGVSLPSVLRVEDSFFYVPARGIDTPVGVNLKLFPGD